METSYVGPPIDDVEILTRATGNIFGAFENKNGFISAAGRLHVPGACMQPAWHSIRAAWEGEFALHRLFPLVKESGLPLAEDCFGDQFLLRDGKVLRLQGETGQIENMEIRWEEFLASSTISARGEGY